MFATDDWMNKATTQLGSKEEKLFHKICEHAWNNGEPGLLFETTINQDTPYKYSNQYIQTTNPCSEQPLPPYGSCNLAAVNLNHDYFNSKGYFDFDNLAICIKAMVNYLDATGSANKFPTEKHEQWYKDNRPIGVDFMGIADLFLRYGIEYGSMDSLNFLHKILFQSYYSAEEESIILGKALGIPKQCEVLPVPKRNITLLTIAPTGSRAIIADCSHSLEPIFAPAFERIDERGMKYIYVHPKANKEYFVSAIGDKQPTWKQQIDLVATCYRWIDSGISKTINLPNSATIQDLFMLGNLD